MSSEFPNNSDQAPDEPDGTATESLYDDLKLEKKWLKRAIIDLDNFAFFYDRYHKAFYKYVFLRTANQDTSRDIVNETFSRALSGLGKFKWQGYTVGAWLFQIARSVMYKDHNDRVSRAEVPYELESHEQVDQRTPDKDVERLEDEEILRLCVKELSPLRQDVFVMHYVDGTKNAGHCCGLGSARRHGEISPAKRSP